MVVVVARLATMRSILQALVLAAGQQCETHSTMVARMLIVISQAVHVLVAPLTIANATRKGSQTLLSLALHLAQLALRDVHRGQVEIVIAAQQLRVERGRQSSDGTRLMRPCDRTTGSPTSSLPLSSLPLQEILDMFQIFRRRKVAAAMGHVVLEPVRLLVRFVAVRLRTSEWLG